MAQLYFLTMDDSHIGPVQQVEAACKAGIKWVQLRMKQASDAEVLEVPARLLGMPVVPFNA